ncbi:hypothetical protein RvY_04861 [Ramazzottius varieornatus]|uniref:Chitin-binding type-2 domain-containing protein n=1 Tax=Ramazzottius varieornatus TaxID=947166 RepID=A0A1D1UT40_RAMVA|nr:hypothetical protein RvY_04861 [Ramazzottius varieornatus]
MSHVRFLLGQLSFTGLCLLCMILSARAAQFLWADSDPTATESTISVFDLRRPDFPAERVAEFLNQSVAGRDYPDFLTIPTNLNFSCHDVEQPGFYANRDTGCQVYHRCDPNGRQYDYLCGNQTVFDQLLLTCDFFYKVDCNASKTYFNYVNMHLYKSGEPAPT